MLSKKIRPAKFCFIEEAKLVHVFPKLDHIRPAVISGCHYICGQNKRLLTCPKANNIDHTAEIVHARPLMHIIDDKAALWLHKRSLRGALRRANLVWIIP